MKHKIYSYLLAFAFLSGGSVFAQNETVLPKPGITPESHFYFVDKLGEALREFFTFSSEGKARLQITFAAERVAEIKIILEESGAEARGLAVAQSRLVAHLADAASLVADKKAAGEDVQALAEELDDEFAGPKAVWEEAFRAKKRALEFEADELKMEIKEARVVRDTVRVERLVKQLGEVKARKELLEQKEEEQEEALEREEERLGEEMEIREKAEKALYDAGEERQEAVDEAADEGLILPAETFEKFDHMLAQAAELFDHGNYQGAQQLARQAEKGLEIVADAIEALEEAQEREEGLQDDREEKEWEVQEEEEGLKTEVENGEMERLDKEVEKAEEEIEKAEDRLREIGGADEDDL